MFDLSRKEQQQARAFKPVQSIENISAKLGMNELVQTTTLVNIHNAIRETFGSWAHKVNPDGNGEKIHTYNVMQIIQDILKTQSSLNDVIAGFRDKELQDSPISVQNQLR